MSVILSLQLLASDPVTRITGIDAIVTTDVAVPWFECLHTVWHTTKKAEPNDIPFVEHTLAVVCSRNHVTDGVELAPRGEYD